MMALLAAIVWFGRSYFSDTTGQFMLYGCLTVVGILVALFGVSHVLSWDGSNVLGLRKHYSFGPFVSRNTAGCFLNVCLSASLGLTTLAFTEGKGKHVDRRYSSTPSGRFDSILTRIETTVGQLTTLQIAAIIASALLFASVLATASRGASISSVVAVLAVFLFSTGSGISPGKIILALIIFSVGAAFLFSFELDDRIRERLETTEWGENFEVARRLVWSIARDASLFFAATGSGLGTFHYAHLPFQSESIRGWFYNSESLYWEALVDLGWVGLVGIVGIVATFFYTIKPRLSKSSTARSGIYRLAAHKVTGLAMLVSVGLHSFFDFGMIVPACFITAGLLLGAIYGSALAESRKSEKSRSSKPRSERRRLTDISRAKESDAIAPDASNESTYSSDPEPSPRWLAILVSLLVGMSIAGIFWFGQSGLALLAKADRMRLWNSRQVAMPVAERVGIPTVFLAGIWGADPEGFETTPDATRLLGYAMLSEFTVQRTEDLREALGVPLATAASLASPTITHMTLSGAQSSVDAVDEAFQSPEQKKRWLQARRLFESGIVKSPLDWRFSYSLYILGYELPASELSNLAIRLERLSRHQPSFLLQVAVVENSHGRRENAIDLLRTNLAVDLSADRSVAKLLDEWYEDGEVPVNVFQDNIPHLLRVAALFPENRSPMTHAQIISHAEVLANDLSRIDPKRAVYLAQIARDRKDYLAVIEHSNEAIRRNPGDWKLRVDIFNAAFELGDLKEVEEQVKILSYQARGEKILDSLQKRLENAKAQL